MGHRFSKTAANAAYTTTPVNQAAHPTFCCSISKRPIANTLATATTATIETTTPITTRTSTVTPAKSAICMANHRIVEEMSSPSAQQMHVLPETPLHLTAHMNRLATLTNRNDGNDECSLSTTAIDTSATATATTSACNNFNPCERSSSNTNSNFNLNSNTNLFEQSLANTCYRKTAPTAAAILQHSSHNDHSHSHSLSSINNLSCGRQIIIKIQLAKMENGNGQTSTMQRQYQQLQASPALALSSSLSTMPSSTHLIESPITDGNQNILDDSLLINKTAAIPIITNTTTTATTTTADHTAAVPLAALMTDVFTTDDQQLNLSLNIEDQSSQSPLSSSLSTLWPSSHSSTLLRGTAGSSSEYTSMPKDNFHNRAIPNALNISNDTSISHHAASTIVPSIHTTCDLRNATPLFNTAITNSDSCGESRSSTKDHRGNGVGGIAASLTTDATCDDKDCRGHHHRHHLISGFMQFNDNELKMQNTDETVDYYEVLEGNDLAIATTAAITAVEAQEAEAASYSSSLSLPPLTPQTQMNNNNNISGIATDLYAESKTCCRGNFIKLPAQSNASPMLSSSSDDPSPATSVCSVGPVATKWRYRDIFRRLLEPVSLRACNKVKHHRDGRKPIMEQSTFGRKCKKQHAESFSEKEIKLGAAGTRTSTMTASLLNECLHPDTPFGGNVSQQEVILTSASPISVVSAASVISDTKLRQNIATTTTVAAVGNPNSQLSIWASNRSNSSSDVIIPIATQPQFVVVQCSILNAALDESVNSSNNAVGFPTAAVNDLLTAAVDDSNEGNMNPNENCHILSLPNEAKESVNNSRVWISNGPVVHSQIDFCHHLVPDLERIIQSSFYWGKMDRYEAERLLEGNPEGTFLLRDSAQEEFLFSVTFRKYGRSLHARIEQSGHRFSFDCHDPCVFTASTVTGLLEHYKDPACVMFFEPMLTIPLHRKTCFSLQQLCRATIVSHITYDGINKLELPSRLKSFLKEYHYKQKLRVKPFDEPYYI